MRNFIFLTLFFVSLGGVDIEAQNPDFEQFIQKFPKQTLPYKCVYQPNLKFNKSLKITPSEATTWLTSFKTPEGVTINLYESLIEPFGPAKSPEGKTLVSKMKAQKLAILKQTDEYIALVIRIYFIDQIADYLEGERYLLHTFKLDGTPVSALWIAQRIQFDLHYNQISSQIDENGNITSLVEVFAPSANTQTEEKYQILDSGEIVVLKNSKN
ncbi:MAG: hypothetical protein MUE85_04705 [Microscillaceae bacterium]|jgi:hypothetical protein|nr:hypothetical protein [Microscillaceae bacterium]